MRRNGYYLSYLPGTRKFDGGDFDRLTPISKDFGFDRGGAIDRYYIENFLKQASPLIQGKVLEVGDSTYTRKYGGRRVSDSQILHVADTENVTIVGDLANAPHIQSNSFDCIILTQTIHLIFEYKDAIRTCFRILKPGGTLLLTAPGITPIAHDQWKDFWCWSFTEKALSKLIKDVFGDQVACETFGNVFVAAAFLYGLGLPEMRQQQLDYQDEHYPVIITINATKPHHV